MSSQAPYQSIRHIVSASFLECPCQVSICDMCMYHDFCSALSKAFGEVKKLSETDETIKGILDEAYNKRRREVIERLENGGE